MKYLNIRLNASYGIQGHLNNILAQMIHAYIWLSSHCNFIHLRVKQNRHFRSWKQTEMENRHDVEP